MNELSLTERRRLFNTVEPDDRWMYTILPDARISYKLFAKLTFDQVRAIEKAYEAIESLSKFGLGVAGMDNALIFQLVSDKNDLANKEDYPINRYAPSWDWESESSYFGSGGF